LGQVNAARAGLGAVVNRLTSAADNLTNISQNLSASRSRVLDTDYATATTDLARTMIIQQAGTAVLAQANQSSQSVLALLR
jgi:flagellin